MTSDEARASVDREMPLFRAALPSLIAGPLRGRWVVWLHGAVQSDHETGEEAYLAAVARFGRCGGFVVAPVEEERVEECPGFAVVED